MTQSALTRTKRLNEGRCPVHGLWMSQIDVWYKSESGKDYTIVGCPRRSCTISAKTSSIDGPWELPETLAALLNDNLPDPTYLDDSIKPKKTRKPLQKFKKAVFAKTNGKCYYCGKTITNQTMTIDHLVPSINDGCDEIENLVPACRACNSAKGPKSLDEFKFLMRMNLFEKANGVRFSMVQVEFLQQRKINLNIPNYAFWFEKNA